MEAIRKIKNKKNILKILLNLCALISLSGCATYGTDFECKAGKGLGCTSSSKVLDLIENDQIEEAIARNNSPKSAKKNESAGRAEEDVSKDCKDCQNGPKETKVHAKKEALPSLLSPDFYQHWEAQNNKQNHQNQLVSRSKEKLIKIWFNEYIDDAGNFNGEQEVYTVIENSKWVRN